MEAVTNAPSSCGDREDGKTPEYQILALARTLADVFLTGSAQPGGPGELLHPSTRCPFLWGTHCSPGAAAPWVCAGSPVPLVPGTAPPALGTPCQRSREMVPQH